ncbi:unnamed protein product [Tenebrio molitor]|nr:unnamed protein product [Tenebrio molitor]
MSRHLTDLAVSCRTEFHTGKSGTDVWNVVQAVFDVVQMVDPTGVIFSTVGSKILPSSRITRSLGFDSGCRIDDSVGCMSAALRLFSQVLDRNCVPWSLNTHFGLMYPA